VEADHGDSASRAEHLERGGKTDLERLELVIHLDPQRLEDALCRMSLTEARRRRDGCANHVDELPRPLDRRLLATPHDAA
jgi:hypothetical protein